MLHPFLKSIIDGPHLVSQSLQYTDYYTRPLSGRVWSYYYTTASCRVCVTGAVRCFHVLMYSFIIILTCLVLFQPLQTLGDNVPEEKKNTKQKHPGIAPKIIKFMHPVSEGMFRFFSKVHYYSYTYTQREPAVHQDHSQG